MPGSIGNVLELKLLDHTLKVEEYLSPSALYIALSLTDPLDTGAGITEPTDDAYFRKQFEDWTTAADRSSSNASVIQFSSTVDVGFGDIAYWALYDHPTAGNMLAHGDVNTTRGILVGNIPIFEIGDVVISVTSGGVSTYLANKWLDHFLMVAAFTVPTSLYAFASDTTVVDADTGSTISEPSGGDYARTLVDVWDVAATGATANTNAIIFPSATGDWFLVIDSGLVDASSAGNLLFYIVLDDDANVQEDDVFKFNAGEFDINLN